MFCYKFSPFSNPILTRHNTSDTGGRDEDSEPRPSALRRHLVVIYTRLVSTSFSNVKCVLSRRKPLAINTRKQLASCADALSSWRNDSSPTRFGEGIVAWRAQSTCAGLNYRIPRTRNLYSAYPRIRGYAVELDHPSPRFFEVCGWVDTRIGSGPQLSTMVAATLCEVFITLFLH